MPIASRRSISRQGLLLATAWILLGIAAGMVFRVSSTPLWPAPIMTVAFTDQEHGGLSTARIDTTGGVLHLATKLDSGAQFPLVGAILFLGTDSSSIDMSTHGTLELDLGPSDMPAITACLVEDLPGFTRPDAWQTGRYECSDLELLPGTSTYRLPLEKFSTPSWWYVLSGLRLSQTGPEKRTRIVRLILQTTEGALEMRRPYDLRVRSIAVREERPWTILLGLVAGILCALLQLAWMRHLGIRKTDLGPLASPVPTSQILFQPIEAKSYADREREAVVECIGRDYPDPELSLEKVSRSTGVPLDRVTSHVKTASGLFFKAYLNRVRGEAAQRLLQETDLPVSEVAQRVGYGSPAHFNRVFRELYDTTPTALRERHAAPQAESANPESD